MCLVEFNDGVLIPQNSTSNVDLYGQNTVLCLKKMAQEIPFSVKTDTVKQTGKYFFIILGRLFTKDHRLEGLILVVEKR